MHPTTRRHAYRNGIGLILVAALIIGACIFAMPRAGYWKAAIATLGSERAALALVAVAAPFSAYMQHDAAHAFGVALFESGGSLSECPDAYSYGCAHQYFMKSFEVSGAGALGDLARTCMAQGDMSAQMSCAHGFGHGLVYYTGYEVSDLSAALRSCRELGLPEALGGCFGGVFMEYNTRTMAPESGLREQRDGFDPCLGLSGNERSACFFWLPQLWDWERMRAGHESDLRAYLDSCARLREAADAHYCRMGVGNRVLWAEDMSLERSLLSCDASAADWDEQMSCRSAMAAEAGASTSQAHIETRCRDLLPDERMRCVAWHPF